ncbi:hypothetical protein BPOR_2248g00010 [Botrytis porri]|uniref:Uncharacterized protein n=1 Tax=Botrytis porri TaxID=87229 RepID=A0A4Z1JV31_9HELO|nr:hypothetical protein BPOR_2248g00010 [Botrytis porri]
MLESNAVSRAHTSGTITAVVSTLKLSQKKLVFQIVREEKMQSYLQQCISDKTQVPATTLQPVPHRSAGMWRKEE